MLRAYKAEGHRQRLKALPLTSFKPYRPCLSRAAQSGPRTTGQPLKGLPLLPLERILVLLDAQLVQRDVVGLLLPDVLGYRRLVQADGRHAAALGPEVPVAELVLEVGALVEHHERALALEVAHEAGHADLGRYADQHVDVVGHQVPLDYLHPLVPAQVAEYLAQRIPVLAVYQFAPILRCEHDVVLAHPLRVRQAVCLVCQNGRLSGLIRLEHPYRIPIGGVLTQGRSLRRAPA